MAACRTLHPQTHACKGSVAEEKRSVLVTQVEELKSFMAKKGAFRAELRRKAEEAEAKRIKKASHLEALAKAEAEMLRLKEAKALKEMAACRTHASMHGRRAWLHSCCMRTWLHSCCV